MVATKDGAGLFSPLADERTRLGRRLEERCRETLGDQDNQLAEALYHALASPGKFVRSLLLLDVAWLSVVSEMLGHALAAFTLPTYGHGQAALQRSARGAMARLFGGAATESATSLAAQLLQTWKRW